MFPLTVQHLQSKTVSEGALVTPSKSLFYPDKGRQIQVFTPGRQYKILRITRNPRSGYSYGFVVKDDGGSRYMLLFANAGQKSGGAEYFQVLEQADLVPKQISKEEIEKRRREEEAPQAEFQASLEKGILELLSSGKSVKLKDLVWNLEYTLGIEQDPKEFGDFVQQVLKNLVKAKYVSIGEQRDSFRVTTEGLVLLKDIASVGESSKQQNPYSGEEEKKEVVPEIQKTPPKQVVPPTPVTKVPRQSPSPSKVTRYPKGTQVRILPTEELKPALEFFFHAFYSPWKANKFIKELLPLAEQIVLVEGTAIHDKSGVKVWKGRLADGQSIYLPPNTFRAAVDRIAKLSWKISFPKEFTNLLDSKNYSYHIDDGTLIIDREGDVYLDSLTTLPNNVQFNNKGNVYLLSLTTLPNNVQFNNEGFVNLDNLTTLPDNVQFNNKGDVSLFSLTTLPNNVQFNNRGYVYLLSLTTLLNNVQFNNKGYVYLNNLITLPNNVQFNNEGDVDLCNLTTLPDNKEQIFKNYGYEILYNNWDSSWVVPNRVEGSKLSWKVNEYLGWLVSYRRANGRLRYGVVVEVTEGSELWAVWEDTEEDALNSYHAGYHGQECIELPNDSLKKIDYFGLHRNPSPFEESSTVKTAKLSWKISFPKEFTDLLSSNEYSYHIDNGTLTIDHKGYVYLDSLTTLPSNVQFNNEGFVNLYSLTTLPSNVQFNNEGFVNLSSLTTLPSNVQFNNGGDVYLLSLTTLPNNVQFNNKGYVYLNNLITLPNNVQFNNEGYVYLNSLTPLPENKEQIFKNYGYKVWYNGGNSSWEVSNRVEGSKLSWKVKRKLQVGDRVKILNKTKGYHLGEGNPCYYPTTLIGAEGTVKSIEEEGRLADKVNVVFDVPPGFFVTEGFFAPEDLKFIESGRPRESKLSWKKRNLQRGDKVKILSKSLYTPLDTSEVYNLTTLRGLPAFIIEVSSIPQSDGSRICYVSNTLINVNSRIVETFLDSDLAPWSDLHTTSWKVRNFPIDFISPEQVIKVCKPGDVWKTANDFYVIILSSDTFALVEDENTADRIWKSFGGRSSFGFPLSMMAVYSHMRFVQNLKKEVE